MTATGPAMRYERVAMLNIGTALVPNYVLMGEGFETVDDELNPEVDEVCYVSDVSATKTVTGYAPEWSFDGSVIKDSTVISFLRAIGDSQATGSAAETDVVLYDVWNAVGADVDAYKYAVAVKMDSTGSGEGGGKLKFSGALLGQGDAVAGSYNTTTDVFTADAVS